MKELLSSLDLTSIPQMSLGTGALLILAACAVIAIVRGIVRMLLGSLVLCASGAAAYLAWRHTPVVAAEGQFHWVSFVPPVIVGLLVFWVLRKLMKFVTNPFAGGEEGGDSPRSPLRWVLTLLFSLVPTSLIWVTGATALRSAGSVAEIRRFVDGSSAGEESAFLAALKTAIDRVTPGDWMKSVDPLSDKARVTLAKLIALGDSAPPPKAIAVLEEPQIRDLIQNDPKLRTLAKARRYADILRDPRLDNVVADPDLAAMLSGLDL